MMFSTETLYDLDVLSHGGVENSLFGKLNHCKTKGAEIRLRAAFHIPYDGSMIRQRQDAIRHIAAHLSDWQFSLRENEIWYAQEYLRTSYTPVKTKNPVKHGAVSLFKFFACKAQYHFILSGVKQLLNQLKGITNLYENGYRQDMPPLLKTHFQALSEQLNNIRLHPDLADLFRDGEPSPAKVFKTDTVLRTQYAKIFTEVFETYYELEALYSLAVAHVSMHLNFPVLTEDTSLMQITDLKHPLIAHCKGNDVRMSQQGNLMILTGPNMAGKSSYIKSIGLAFFMAYLGMGIDAAEGMLPIYSQVLTSIRIADSVGEGYSYFFNEVKTVKAIAEVLRKRQPVMVIADELFKGTNVKDTYDCSKIMLDGFLQHKESCFIVATHLTELAEEFKSDSGAILQCFDGAVDGKGFSFSYQLKPGISTTRLGKHILAHEGVPELLGLGQLTMDNG